MNIIIGFCNFIWINWSTVSTCALIVLKLHLVRNQESKRARLIYTISSGNVLQAVHLTSSSRYIYIYIPLFLFLCNWTNWKINRWTSREMYLLIETRRWKKNFTSKSFVKFISFSFVFFFFFLLVSLNWFVMRFNYTDIDFLPQYSLAQFFFSSLKRIWRRSGRRRIRCNWMREWNESRQRQTWIITKRLMIFRLIIWCIRSCSTKWP